MGLESDRSATLPWSSYTDAEVLRLEHERIFRRSWHYVGRFDQVPESGRFFSAWAADVPVVVVREGSAVRAFLNVCRHRGSVVAEGAGVRQTLQCPYHAWTYGLDGRLLAAPRSEREEGFDPAGLGLVALPLETWGPFFFVNPDPDCAPLADTLGDVPELLREGGIDVDELRFRRRAEFELAANWKIACENYLECYHCPTAHPGFSALVDVSPDAYRLEANGSVFSQFGPVRDTAANPLAGGDVPASQFHFVWPNLKINVYPGRPNLSIGPVVPTGAERSTGFLDYYFGEEVESGWIEELLSLDDEVGRQDLELVENVQRGVRSGVLCEGRLLGRSEQLVAGFQRLVASHLQS